jgi:hypothetical protein
MTFRSLTLHDIDHGYDADPQHPRWRLGAPLGAPGGMTVPVQAVFVHHTVSPDTGDVVHDVAGPCDTDQRNFGKVSYSWNIHESTSSLIEVEGTRRGAHTINNRNESLNGISFGFGVIGNFHPPAPNPPARTPSDGLIALIAEAIVDKAIRPGHAAPTVPILGHRDAPYATACCGDLLYARLPDIRAAVVALVATPIAPEEDMTPGQCRDKLGRKWFFVVGDNRRCFASVDGGKFFDLGVEMLWTSGLDAYLDPATTDGRQIVVAGRGGDGALWQVIVDPGPDKNTPGAKPVLNKVGGHIFPAA